MQWETATLVDFPVCTRHKDCRPEKAYLSAQWFVGSDADELAQPTHCVVLKKTSWIPSSRFRAVQFHKELW